MVDAPVVVKTRMLVDGQVRPMCIGIDAGRITAVKQALKGDVTHDFSRHLTLPGGVDIHTHMREPGMSQKEDFYTGTLSAAFGGTTTILDMPNTDPAVVNADIFRSKLETIKDKANVDFGLFAKLTSVTPLRELADMAMGFKLYMSETTGTDGSAANMEELLSSEHLAGKVITVHAEDASKFSQLKCTSLRTHNVIRNMEAETSAVEQVLALETRGILNLAHLTTTGSIELARVHKTSFEVTPHHFLLHDDADIGTLGKVNPPLRHRDVSMQVFEQVKAGNVDIIASDHAPHTTDEKLGGFEDAPSGLPGVETRLPLLMALAKKGEVALDTVRSACCQRPADLFHLKKGRIEVGYDADLAMFDMDRIEKVSGEKMHSKCGWTPFEGHEAIFPDAVMLRSQFIIKDGKLLQDRTGRKL
jgi:dihydroorotase